MPVGTNDCVMNKICRKFEQEFDSYMRKHGSSRQFDYSIMKSDSTYTSTQFANIKRLYEEYNNRLVSYAIFSDYERVDEIDSFSTLSDMNAEFRRMCDSVCPDKSALCNIILDICYKKKSTKRFAWNMCGEEIIKNLLAKNDNIISYPTIDPNGDISYCNNKFSIKQKVLEVVE